MEDQREDMQKEEEERKESYVPRPAWQVWGARIGLVIFIAFLVIYYLLYFTGGGA